MKQKIAIFIRGHERNSFKKEYMRIFLEKIDMFYDFDLYIHTWNVSEAKMSWRTLDYSNLRKIDERCIRDYFYKFNDKLKLVIIDDDRNIKLEQTTDGTLMNTPMKKLPWKNMWYGKKRLIDSISEPIEYKFILNTRFDYFCRIHDKNEDPIKSMDSIISNIFWNHDENFFGFINQSTLDLYNSDIDYSNKQKYGAVDNMYVSNYENMKNLIYWFHFHLDDILIIYEDKNILVHETIVFMEAKKIDNYSYGKKIGIY